MRLSIFPAAALIALATACASDPPPRPSYPAPAPVDDCAGEAPAQSGPPYTPRQPCP